MKVVGIKKVSYQKDGKDVRGLRVHMTYPITKDGEGVGVDTVYLTEWFVNNRMDGHLPQIGDDIEPCYNKQGKLSDIRYVAYAK